MKKQLLIVNLIFQTLIFSFLLFVIRMFDIDFEFVEQYYGVIAGFLLIIYLLKITFFCVYVSDEPMLLYAIKSKQLFKRKALHVVFVIILIAAIISVVASLKFGEWEVDDVVSVVLILLCVIERSILITYLVSLCINIYHLYIKVKPTVFKVFSIVGNTISNVASNRGFTVCLNVIMMALSIIMLILNIYRFYIYIIANSFWADEIFFIKLCNMNLFDLMQASISDCNPPLHYILTKFLIVLFGNSPLIYRFFSFFPYIICLIHGFIFFKNNFNFQSATLWTLFISTTYYSMYHMMDARMYFLEFLFIYFMLISIYHIVNSNKVVYWIMLFVFSVLALYTHTYSTVFVFFIYIMLLLIVLIWKNSFQRIIILYLCTLLTYLPWIRTLFIQFSKVSGLADLWITEVKTSTIFSSFYLYEKSNNSDKFYAIYYIVAFFIVLFLITTVIKLVKDKNVSYLISKNFIYVFIGLFSIILSIALVQILSMIYRPMVVFRYIFPLSSVVFIVSIFIFNQFSFGKALIVCLCIFVFIVGYNNVKFDIKHRAYINGKLNTTIENISNQFMNGCGVLLTNHSHINWNIGKYYFPNADVKMIGETELTNEDLSKPILIALDYFSNKEIVSEFCNKNNVHATFIQEYGVLGDRYFINLFKVEK